jgi:hypothetical protein
MQIRYTHFNTENIFKISFFTDRPYRQKNKQRSVTSRFVRYEMAGVLLWDVLKANVYSNYPRSADDRRNLSENTVFSFSRTI